MPATFIRKLLKSGRDEEIVLRRPVRKGLMIVPMLHEKL